MVKKVNPLDLKEMFKDNSFKAIWTKWAQGEAGRTAAAVRLGQFYVYQPKILKKIFKGFTGVKITKSETFERASDKNVPIPKSIRGKPLLSSNVTPKMYREMDRIVIKYMGEADKKCRTDKDTKEIWKIYNRNREKARSKVGGQNTKVFVVRNYNKMDEVWSKQIAPKISDILIAAMVKQKKLTAKEAEALKGTGLLGSAMRGDSGAQKTGLTKDKQAITDDTLLGMHLGHGEHGKAVSVLQAEAFAAQTEKDFKDGKISRDEYLRQRKVYMQFEDEAECVLDVHTVAVTDDNIDIQANFIVSSQMASENKADAQKRELSLQSWLYQSITTKEKSGAKMGMWVGYKIEDNLVDRLIKPWLKVSGASAKAFKDTRNAAKLAIKQGKYKNTQTNKIRQAAIIVTGVTGAIKKEDLLAYSRKEEAAARKQSMSGKKGTKSYALIKNKIRNKIHDELERRMIYPRLQYDSGDFANSVQLQSLTQTGDQLRAEYTYNLERYNTFEAGGRQFTPARDPKDLIEKALERLIFSEGKVMPNVWKRV